jgi:hypothetical protein
MSETQGEMRVVGEVQRSHVAACVQSHHVGCVHFETCTVKQ